MSYPPGTRVTFSDYDVDDLDPPRGVVIDHLAADMRPPTDEALVLVRWSRNSLRWEYVEDVCPAPTR